MRWPWLGGAFLAGAAITGSGLPGLVARGLSRQSSDQAVFLDPNVPVDLDPRTLAEHVLWDGVRKEGPVVAVHGDRICIRARVWKDAKVAIFRDTEYVAEVLIGEGAGDFCWGHLIYLVPGARVLPGDHAFQR